MVLLSKVMSPGMLQKTSPLKSSSKHKKNQCRYRRTVRRRVSILMDGHRQMEIPTNNCPRSLRFPYNPVTQVREIATATPEDLVILWYSPCDYNRMRDDMQQEVAKARASLDKDGTFDDNDDLELRGLEEFVTPAKATKRLHRINAYTKSILVAQQHQEKKQK